MKLILLRDKKVFFLFIQLALISFGLGIARLLLPFQIVYLGGEEYLVSVTSVLYSIGQISGIILLSHICERRKSEFVVTTLLWILSLLTLSIPFLPIFLMGRFFEGLGYGLLLVGILNYADRNYEDSKGEVVGSVFGSIFFGGAIGQGLAGFLEESIGNLFQSTIFSAFQILMLAGITISFVSLLIAFMNFEQDKKFKIFKMERISLPHLHWKNIKTILGFTPFTLLFLIYAFYDFSHGIYTPNLALVLASNNLTKTQISIVYFTGDAVLGLSQIMTGRLVDKLGSWIPMFLSLSIKGLAVLFYDLFYLWTLVLMLFVIVGIGESLVEPARNIAILKIENHFDEGLLDSYSEHSHRHLNISFSKGQGFTFGAHSHVHEHTPDRESIISWLQLTSIISYGLGGFIGSIILTIGGSAELLIYIGSIILLLGSLIALFGRL
ncbi:MAG: MFS transporter [Candidatus Lokiarchaeota archaeon]|nr:MFS transporter [Candidatus Lokiarchaeota archaeon]